MLRNFAKTHGSQYYARRDNKGTWRIINLYHPDLENYNDSEDDIPDTHPAVTVITEGAFLELMDEARKIGIAHQLNVETGTFNVSDDAYDKLLVEKKELEEKLNNKKEEKETEEFKLATHKLTVIHDLAKEGALDENVLKAVRDIGGNENV